MQIKASHKQNEPIVSGTQAALGQFPWHVLLKKDKNDDVWCGGSIITNKWVLTAAHCLYGQRSIFMAFGTIEQKNSEISMTSNKFVIYPAYDDNNVFDDIGLIALPNPLNFTPNIQAIDLVTAAEAAKHNFWVLKLPFVVLVEPLIMWIKVLNGYYGLRWKLLIIQFVK
ncbi:collagenase-like [Lucilia sericata]|uniref:collagenase-like n=1 Tax=Lucilia sericata TaxID=13632 RepID=UPI0018A7FD0C|nr:collagenase-like [Lucilia sericata]